MYRPLDMGQRAANGRRWKVGELASATGLTVRTLHHYERIGLLSPAQRTEGNQRLYDEGDVVRLYRIRALRDLGLSLVATNDVHYLQNSDFKPHDVLLCIGTGKSVNDAERLRYHGDQFYLKTAEEMAAVFKEHPDALANTVRIAERCNVDLSNAINHLSMSGEGNVLAGQIAKTTANSNGSRTVLNNNSDLFVVTNLHAVLAGGTPTAFLVSQAQSHGASVAFVGEGTAGGPQAILFSSAASGSTNSTWSTRTLKSVPLASGAVATVLDSTQSHYIVLAGGRRLNDNATTAD